MYTLLNVTNLLGSVIGADGQNISNALFSFLRYCCIFELTIIRLIRIRRGIPVLCPYKRLCCADSQYNISIPIRHLRFLRYFIMASYADQHKNLCYDLKVY